MRSRKYINRRLLEHLAILEATIKHFIPGHQEHREVAEAIIRLETFLGVQGPHRFYTSPLGVNYEY